MPALGVYVSAPVLTDGSLGGVKMTTGPLRSAVPYKFDGALSTALSEWWEP